MSEKRDIYLAVRNFMINEVLAKAARADGEQSWKRWLRKQFVEAMHDAFAGHDRSAWVQQAIRDEVGSILSKWGSKDALKSKIEEVVREEVRALIKANLVVDAKLTLDLNPKRYEGQGEF
jgi:hypothetical protein